MDIPADPFLGTFDIHFNGPRKVVIGNVRIVHWKQSPNAELCYLIGDDGSLYNFKNVTAMIRIDD